jgi:hypothetical protein
MPLIKEICLSWDTKTSRNRKHCSIYSLNTNLDLLVEEFAYELARHGFWSEVVYIKVGIIVEYFHNNEFTIIRDEKHASTTSFDKT